MPQPDELRTIIEFTSIVRVLPGNTVNISFGEDAVASRQVGFQKAQALLAVDAKGFDPTNNMELVVPRTRAAIKNKFAHHLTTPLAY